MSEDTKAAEDWSSYEIPTDAQMLAKHNAEENRKNKHLLGILHNMVLDKNYHGTHEANTLRKQCNEQAKALTMVVAKVSELVSRIVELEALVEQHSTRLDKASEYLKTLKTREETK